MDCFVARAGNDGVSCWQMSPIHVFASTAKQSIPPHKESMDCFVASAPRNDEETAEATHSLPAAATKSYRCSGRGKLPPPPCAASETKPLAPQTKRSVSSTAMVISKSGGERCFPHPHETHKYLP